MDLNMQYILKISADFKWKVNNFCQPLQASLEINDGKFFIIIAINFLNVILPHIESSLSGE
jgi:hypothetical protein